MFGAKLKDILFTDIGADVVLADIVLIQRVQAAGGTVFVHYLVRPVVFFLAVGQARD